MGRMHCARGSKEEKGCSCYHPHSGNLILKGHDKGQTGRGKAWRTWQPPGKRSWKFFKWNPDPTFSAWASNFLWDIQRE